MIRCFSSPVHLKGPRDRRAPVPLTNTLTCNSTPVKRGALDRRCNACQPAGSTSLDIGLKAVPRHQKVLRAISADLIPGRRHTTPHMARETERAEVNCARPTTHEPGAQTIGLVGRERLVRRHFFQISLRLHLKVVLNMTLEVSSTAQLASPSVLKPNQTFAELG